MYCHAISSQMVKVVGRESGENRGSVAKGWPMKSARMAGMEWLEWRERM